MVIEVARDLYFEAVNIENLKTREAVASFATRCEQRSYLENHLELLKHLPPIAEAGDRWNPQTDELNTPSGLVNLQSRRVRDATPTDLVTFSTTAMYNPSADCPRFEQFIEEISDGNQELASFHQRWAGYCLTARMCEQVFRLDVGSGANGKSVLIETVERIWGDYSHSTSFSTFELGQRPTIGHDLAALTSRRVVFASEVNSGTRLNAQRIKALTGGDKLNARHLYGHAFEFYPVCKLWLSVNHRPRITDDSFGMWRRVLLVPFTRTFLGADRDERLNERLMLESEGILRWAVDGAANWYEQGLNPPAIVRAAVNDYQASSDPLSEFLDERCETGPEATCRAGKLFKAYAGWCDELGIATRERASHRTFGELMKARVGWRKESAGIVYLGFRLNQPEPVQGQRQ